jgi:hypothetical protein
MQLSYRLYSLHVAHQGGVGVQLLCCFWSGCWAPPVIRELGVSAGGGGAVGLRQPGSLGCCVWPASRFRLPCNQQQNTLHPGCTATSALLAFMRLQVPLHSLHQCALTWSVQWPGTGCKECSGTGTGCESSVLVERKQMQPPPLRSPRMVNEFLVMARGYAQSNFIKVHGMRCFALRAVRETLTFPVPLTSS